jgi:hypothetical protein
VASLPAQVEQANPLLVSQAGEWTADDDLRLPVAAEEQGVPQQVETATTQPTAAADAVAADPGIARRKEMADGSSSREVTARPQAASVSAETAGRGAQASPVAENVHSTAAGETVAVRGEPRAEANGHVAAAREATPQPDTQRPAALAEPVASEASQQEATATGPRRRTDDESHSSVQGGSVDQSSGRSDHGAQPLAAPNSVATSAHASESADLDHSTRALPAHVAAQRAAELAAALTTGARHSGETVALHLGWDDLGVESVVVGLHAGRASVEVACANPDAATMVRALEAPLRERLQAGGMELQDFSATAQGGGQGSQDQPHRRDTAAGQLLWPTNTALWSSSARAHVPVVGRGRLDVLV